LVIAPALESTCEVESLELGGYYRAKGCIDWRRAKYWARLLALFLRFSSLLLLFVCCWVAFTEGACLLVVTTGEDEKRELL
jgi:hypothetical protein